MNLLRLNARVAGLALQGRWLGLADVAEGYDRVAPTYNEAWQCRLRPVTDRLLARLPGPLAGTILDLGCGTGYATRQLALRNPQARVRGVDVSPGMLAQARGGEITRPEFLLGDMLDYVREARTGSARMIVSTWALGYSNPPRLFRECHRVLEPGGTLGFVVNYFDTLAPVFRAYRSCLLRFPDRVRRAAWPRFPRSWDRLRTQLERAGFAVEWHVDGAEPIVPPAGPLLPWLRQTGILAGFEAMLDLSGEVAACFEEALEPHRGDLAHHYAAATAKKSP